MNMRVESFQHRHAAHCESGVASSMLSHHGAHISEAMAFGLSGASLGVVVASASVPTASSAYVLARQMGGDAPVMAQILTLQTIVAMASMPLIIWLVT